MIFFGVYFLLAPTPDKTIFANYLRSRRIMGCALLLLAANYAVHFFFEIRLRDVHAAILMNLSTCFLCYWLFSSALTTLPDRYVFLWILSSVPFYIYLYCSYMNYLLFYERVEQALEEEIPADHAPACRKKNGEDYRHGSSPEKTLCFTNCYTVVSSNCFDSFISG